jgi:hypothetical protein
MRFEEATKIHAADFATSALLLEKVFASTIPLVIKGAAFSSSTPTTHASMRAAVGATILPKKSDRNFFVGTQTGEVMSVNADPFHPDGCTMSTLLDSIENGHHYLATKTGKKAVVFDGTKLTQYIDPLISPVSADVVFSDTVLDKVLTDYPVPTFLPQDSPFLFVLWVGSHGKNFGLHTDMFCNQFITQNEGEKRFRLVLPEDSPSAQPFKYLDSLKFYKSEARTVDNLTLSDSDTVYEVVLTPGDVLFIPPWWWHEVSAVSEGPSVSGTFRFHLDQSDQFYSALTLIHKLDEFCKNSSDSRLRNHVRSFIANSLYPIHNTNEPVTPQHELGGETEGNSPGESKKRKSGDMKGEEA